MPSEGDGFRVGLQAEVGGEPPGCRFLPFLFFFTDPNTDGEPVGDALISKEKLDVISNTRMSNRQLSFLLMTINEFRILKVVCLGILIKTDFERKIAWTIFLTFDSLTIYC
jgi:hypothetical protein